MALKSVLFVLVMVTAVGAPLVVEAQLGNIIGIILCLIRIQGTVLCTANGTATPVFPNAIVQLQCGNGNIVSTATTDNIGIFLMFLDPLGFMVSSVLSDCNVVVTTPLSNCNATLPSIGNLISSLTTVGNTLQGPLRITNLVPSGFQLQQ